MNIYQIDAEMQRIWAQSTDPETGEVVDEDLFAELDKLGMERDKKVENMACWVKNLEADAKAIREEEKALAERRKVIENDIARKKSYLMYALNGEKFTSPRVGVTFRTTKSVSVLMPDLIPEKYLRFKEPEPDKTEIAKALKAGMEVPGCVLSESLSMTIK